MKVLIVDDEEIVRKSLKRAFQMKGHEVSEAGDGEQAVSLWFEFQPEVVLLDVLMPKMSGPEVLGKMSGHSKAKVLLMSAYKGQYDSMSAKSLGAQAFISKPFEDIFDIVAAAEELAAEELYAIRQDEV